MYQYMDTKLWGFMKDENGSHELKQIMALKASAAIKQCDISLMRGPVSLFKPDNMQTEDTEGYDDDEYVNKSLIKLSPEYVERWLEGSSLMAFVEEQIREKTLENLVAGKYACQKVETFMKDRARVAIAKGIMLPLRIGFSVASPDGMIYTMDAAEVEEKSKESGLWDYVMREISKSAK